MERISTLYQPVRFKRDKKGDWERGVKLVGASGEKILDYDMKEVFSYYKFEVDWFGKA